MKITILGSSRQIGAYFSEYLREKGHIVIHFDKEKTPNHDMTVIPNQYLDKSVESLKRDYYMRNQELENLCCPCSNYSCT